MVYYWQKIRQVKEVRIVFWHEMSYHRLDNDFLYNNTKEQYSQDDEEEELNEFNATNSYILSWDRCFL